MSLLRVYFLNLPSRLERKMKSCLPADGRHLSGGVTGSVQPRDPNSDIVRLCRVHLLFPRWSFSSSADHISVHLYSEHRGQSFFFPKCRCDLKSACVSSPQVETQQLGGHGRVLLRWAAPVSCVCFDGQRLPAGPTGLFGEQQLQQHSDCSHQLTKYGVCVRACVTLFSYHFSREVLRCRGNRGAPSPRAAPEVWTISTATTTSTGT